MSKKSIQPGEKKKHWTRDDTELTILALPTTVWYILFSFLPMIGILIAFKDFKASGNFLQNVITSPWCGFENFQFLFSSSQIWTVLRNTICYNIVFIILGIVLPVACTLMVSMLHGKRLAKVYQTCMFMPYFLSWVVVTALVWAFLCYDKGLINNIFFPDDKQQWYMKPEIWPFLLTFMNIWKSLGYNMVVYLATVTGIDRSLYEAAIIDGATIWQQVKSITLPMLKSVMIMMFIMAVGRIFNTDFGLFYQVPKDSSSLMSVTQTLDVYVYKMLMNGTTEMASSSAFVQSVAGCITILVANAVVRKIDPDSAMI